MEKMQEDEKNIERYKIHRNIQNMPTNVSKASRIVIRQKYNVMKEQIDRQQEETIWPSM